MSIEDIIREAANAFNMGKADIRSKSRTSQINMARQIVMYLSREFTDLSLKEIAMELGKEHPTIISGIKKIQRDLKSNNKLRDRIEEIKGNLFRV